MNDLQIYEQHAERHEKAWAAFTQIYILEHPKPVAPRWYDGLPYLMLPFSFVVLAGIALSALRTAPVFQQIALSTVGVELATAEALLAVVVIEVFLVLGRYAFILLSAQDGESNIGEVKAWMRAGFWIAFGIAVGANLYASIAHLPIVEPIKPIIDLIIALAVGISAPVLAFISADILGILWARSERRRADLKAQFDTTTSEWFDSREKSWTARKKDYGLRINVETSMSGALSERTDRRTDELLLSDRVVRSDTDTDGHGRTSHASFGHERTPDGLQKALAWFDANPDKAGLSLRELEPIVGVGRDTLSRARRQWQQIRKQDGGES